MSRLDEQGHTLVELLVVVAIIFVMAAFSVPYVRAYSVEAHILGAGRAFKAEFLKARSAAIRSGRYIAIRFEDCDSGTCFATYQDGDADGVRAEDIKTGRDARIAGPFPLTAGAPGVRVGINPDVQAIPPDTGLLSGDPIRFGRSRMASFSPIGGATPGTFYLAGEAAQGAVRVNGMTGRIRLMMWHGTWEERP